MASDVSLSEGLLFVIAEEGFLIFVSVSDVSFGGAVLTGGMLSGEPFSEGCLSSAFSLLFMPWIPPLNPPLPPIVPISEGISSDASA